MGNAYKILIRKPEGKRPGGGPRRRLLRTDLMEIGCENMVWLHLGQDRDQ
jgi:hypothetical protein